MVPLGADEYYEAEMIQMGKDEDGCMTADEDTWVDGQTHWNIWVTLRDDSTDDPFDEVLDLDFPIEMKSLAQIVFDNISSMITICNRQGIKIS